MASTFTVTIVATGTTFPAQPTQTNIITER